VFHGFESENDLFSFHCRVIREQMYFLALRNAHCFSALHTDVLVFVARGILIVCVIICYQVCKVFFADSRSLDGISRYRSVNFIVFVIFFCYYI